MRALKAKGLRITVPRVEVIRVLAATNAALTPPAIHKRILAAGGRIDLVSVYRILETLQEVGLIHHIGIVDGYFACPHSHAGDHAAVHLVCEACGCVIEVAVDPAVIVRIRVGAQAIGFEDRNLRIELSGRCAHCQESPKPPRR